MAEQPLYIFNHIPRTAGGALLAALEMTLNVVYDYLPRDPSDLERWVATPLRLDDLPAGTLIAGHFTASGALLHERYPEAIDNAHFRLITFLRAPYLWCESHIRYFGLDATCRAAYARGAQAGVFARILNAQPEDPAKALSKYWFAGVSERAQTDASELLARMLCPVQILEPTNVSPYRKLSPDEEQFVREYEQNAVWDQRLFDAALHSTW